MPLLAALLSGLFASIAEFFAKHMTKKVAFAAAGITVFSALTIALGLAVGGLVSAVYSQLPNVPGLQLGIWLGFPDNGPFIVSSAVSLDTAIALYKWNMENLRLSSYTS